MYDIWICKLLKALAQPQQGEVICAVHTCLLTCIHAIGSSHTRLTRGIGVKDGVACWEDGVMPGAVLSLGRALPAEAGHVGIGLVHKALQDLLHKGLAGPWPLHLALHPNCNAFQCGSSHSPHLHPHFCFSLRIHQGSLSAPRSPVHHT